MAKRTFPAGDTPRVILTSISGDLSVRVSDDRSITLVADDDAREVYDEGGTITLNGYDGDIELYVPADTSINVTNLAGDVEIEGVREVELNSIGCDVVLKEIAESITLANIGADLEVTTASSLRSRGGIGADAVIKDVEQVEIETVGADLVVKNATNVTVGNVGGDFSAEEIADELRCGSVGGDLEVEGNSQTAVKLSNVGGNFELEGAGHVQVSNVGGDCELSDVSGDVELGNVGGDCELNAIGGNVQASYIGGDGEFRKIQGSIDSGNIGGDLLLQASFPAGSRARLNVGGDAEIILPPNPNLSIRAHVGGEVSGTGITSTFNGGDVVDITYDEGAALLELSGGGDLRLESDGKPRSAKNSFGGFSAEFNAEMSDFGREMADLGREMGQLGKDLGREIAEALSEVGWQGGANWANDFARKVEERANRARQRAEERAQQVTQRVEQAQRRAQQNAREADERSRQAGERARREADRVRVRINEREWRLDPERLERIKEQARRATAEGLSGALEAVERAIGNIRAPQPPMPPMSPVPPMPPRTPATGQTIKIQVDDAPSADTPEREQATQNQSESDAAPARDPEQEREAILRMIAEGRISPDEGDMLLESLGG